MTVQVTLYSIGITVLATTTMEATTSFSLAGDLADYGADARASLQAVLADGAGVPTAAVSLELVAGSVQVSARIQVASQAAADATAASLSQGLLFSAG